MKPDSGPVLLRWMIRIRIGHGPRQEPLRRWRMMGRGERRRYDVVGARLQRLGRGESRQRREHVSAARVGALQRAVGEPVDRYIERRLLAPLGKDTQTGLAWLKNGAHLPAVGRKTLCLRIAPKLLRKNKILFA